MRKKLSVFAISTLVISTMTTLAATTAFGSSDSSMGTPQVISSAPHSETYVVHPAYLQLALVSSDKNATIRIMLQNELRSVEARIQNMIEQGQTPPDTLLRRKENIKLQLQRLK